MEKFSKEEIQTCINVLNYYIRYQVKESEEQAYMAVVIKLEQSLPPNVYLDADYK